MHRDDTPLLADQGSYGTGNFGDDALMVADHDIVSQASLNACISLACRVADYLSRSLPGGPVIDREELAERKPGLFILGGGTQFFSYPKQENGDLIRRALRCCVIPLRWGREHVREAPIFGNTEFVLREVANGFGIGPFSDSVYERRVMRRMLSLNYVTVRDTQSYAYCRQW